MRDIIVIGAPIGGGAALAQIISGFPADLNASVFVVLHLAPETPILLADVLNAPGRLRAAEAIHDEPIQPRRIYLGGAGKDLTIRDNKIFLSGDGENKVARPSIDALFLSASSAYRARVIGVLLLHAREDGAAGLHAIRKAGGRTITHRNEKMLEEPRDPDTSELLCDAHVALEQIAPCVLSEVAMS